MAMDIAAYVEEIRKLYQSGQATEHSYRPALIGLFQAIDPKLEVINEPKRSEGGMPDFLFQRDGVPIGWAEAKDIDKDVLRLKNYSVDQRKRYEAAYPNLVYTNGVDFEFIREGEQVAFVSIADFVMGLQPKPDEFEKLERQLTLFAEQKPVSIRSAAKLAEMMAAKAAIIKDEIDMALADDPEYRSGLGGQFKSFKQNLLPNLTPGEFADIYAETITYGMFAARFHDLTPDSFSRAEALELLPASNPFLKGLFEYIAGAALPTRLRYIVDDLVAVMRASDPHSLFKDFGKFTARNDPFIHFYEDFLAAYNPKKRKSRGVWYTPEPVVDFIVRAVDDVLKSEFGLADGLADTSKVTVDWDTGETDKKGKPVTIKKDVHKVQILDPATGTGTFLAKAVQLISDRVKARAPGKWSGYVEQDLLPRLHGFELLMASYAMCHMKLDMQLTESGYKPSDKPPPGWAGSGQWPPRLSVWLTNALEPAEREVRDLFFQPLAEEARGASNVKRQTPIMCVIGNPPYSGESANKGDHIMGLMEAYKMEPGGKIKLQERNPKWINDDYVKFIRMSEDLIAKNPSGGVLGFITNHGYLDNPTFRGMRWHLLKTFDKIWVLDLHGNSKKKEVSPDGSPDKNVFDIMQGVAIIIAVRKGNRKPSLHGGEGYLAPSHLQGRGGSDEVAEGVGSIRKSSAEADTPHPNPSPEGEGLHSLKSSPGRGGGSVADGGGSPVGAANADGPLHRASAVPLPASGEDFVSAAIASEAKQSSTAGKKAGDSGSPRRSAPRDDVPLAEVWHGDLWGSRKGKNEALWDNGPSDLSTDSLMNVAPAYSFEKTDYELEVEYRKGFSVVELLPTSSVGIVTSRDALTIDVDRDRLWDRVADMQASEAEVLREKYNLDKDVRDWRVEWAKKDISENYDQSNLRKIAYRPFDDRWTFYTGNSRGFMCYPRHDVMRHMTFPNIGLATARSNKNPTQDHFYVTTLIMETKCAESSTQSGIYPLYLYPDDSAEQADAFAATGRQVNFDPDLYAKIREAAGLVPSPLWEREERRQARKVRGRRCLAPIRVFQPQTRLAPHPTLRATFSHKGRRILISARRPAMRGRMRSRCSIIFMACSIRLITGGLMPSSSRLISRAFPILPALKCSRM